MALEERHLLSRHVEGDGTAFRELLGAYRGPVYAYLVRCGVPADVRDDLFQDIFLKIHKGAASYAPERELKPWIFTIAANTVRSHFRAQRVRQLVRSDADAIDAAKDDKPSSDQVAEAKETAAWVEGAIAELQLEQREVLILASIERMSMQEISEALQIPVGTAKTHLRRARIALAAKLARRKARMKREAER